MPGDGPFPIMLALGTPGGGRGWKALLPFSLGPGGAGTVAPRAATKVVSIVRSSPFTSPGLRVAAGLALLWLLLPSPGGSSRGAPAAAEGWAKVPILYNSDVMGKTDPCG